MTDKSTRVGELIRLEPGPGTIPYSRGRACWFDNAKAIIRDLESQLAAKDRRIVKLERTLTTVVRSGAPGGSIMGKRQDGHACQWCRGMSTPCPVETARLALEEDE